MFKFPSQFADYKESRKELMNNYFYKFDENMIEYTFKEIYNNIDIIKDFQKYDFIYSYIVLIETSKNKSDYIKIILTLIKKWSTTILKFLNKYGLDDNKMEVWKIYIFLVSFLLYNIINFTRTKKYQKLSKDNNENNELKKALTDLKKQDEIIFDLGKFMINFSQFDDYKILNNNENISTKVVESLIDILIISKYDIINIKKDFIEPILDILEYNKINQTILRRNLFKYLKKDQNSNEIIICICSRLIEKNKFIHYDIFLNFFNHLKNELLENSSQVNSNNLQYFDNFFNELTLNYSVFSFKIIKDLLLIFKSNKNLIRKIGIKSITNLILKEDQIKDNILNQSNLDTSILATTNFMDLNILEENKKFKKIFESADNIYIEKTKNKNRDRLLQLLVLWIFDKSSRVRSAVIDSFINLSDLNKLTIYEYQLIFNNIKSRVMDSSTIVRKKVLLFLSNIFQKLYITITQLFVDFNNIDFLLDQITKELIKEEDENKIASLKANLEVIDIYKKMIDEFSNEYYIFREYLESKYTSDVISILNFVKTMMDLNSKNSIQLFIYSFNHIWNGEKSISKHVCKMFYEYFYKDNDNKFIIDLEKFTIHLKENDINNLERIIYCLYENYLNEETPCLNINLGEKTWKYFIVKYNKKLETSPIIWILAKIASKLNIELSHILIKSIPNILQNILVNRIDTYESNLIIKELAEIVIEILNSYKNEFFEKYDMSTYTQYFLYFIVKFQGSKVHEFYFSCKIFIKLLFNTVTPVIICQELIKLWSKFLYDNTLIEALSNKDELIKRKLGHLLYVVSEIMLNFKNYKFKKLTEFIDIHESNKKKNPDSDIYLYEEEKLEKGKLFIKKVFSDSFENTTNCFYKYFIFSKSILEEYLTSSEKQADYLTKICLFIYCNFLTLGDNIYKEHCKLFFELIKLNKDLIITKNLIIYCGELMCQYTQIGEDISTVLLPLLDTGNLEIKKTIFTIMSQLTISDLLRVNVYINEFLHLYFNDKMKLMIENYIFQLINKDKKIIINNISSFIISYSSREDCNLNKLKELLFFIIENTKKKLNLIINKLINNFTYTFEKKPRFNTLFLLNEISKSYNILKFCYDNKEIFKKILKEPEMRDLYRKLLINLENYNNDGNMNRGMKNILENINHN